MKKLYVSRINEYSARIMSKDPARRMHNEFARRMTNDPARRMTTHSAFARTIEIRSLAPGRGCVDFFLKIFKKFCKTHRQTDTQTGSPVEVPPVPKNRRIPLKIQFRGPP